MGFDASLDAFRGALAADDYILTDSVLERALAFFLAYHALSGGPNDRLPFAAQTTRNEYLLNVTSAGEAVRGSDALQGALAATHAECPSFREWIRVEEHEEGGGVHVARWLAHVSGFRHRSVHLFLDPPFPGDYVYLQLRSFSKEGYPGCFDVAMGGHLKAGVSMEQALRDELYEELGLDAEEDIEGLEYIGEYDCVDVPDYADVRDTEYLTVYRATWKDSALGNCRFTDGEVAALCLFSVAEAERLVREFPERVASGIASSLDLYLRSRRRNARGSDDHSRPSPAAWKADPS